MLEPKECGSDCADAGTVISDVQMDVQMDEGFGPGLLISEVEAGVCCVLFPPLHTVDLHVH